MAAITLKWFLNHRAFPLLLLAILLNLLFSFSSPLTFAFLFKKQQSLRKQQRGYAILSITSVLFCVDSTYEFKRVLSPKPQFRLEECLNMKIIKVNRWAILFLFLLSLAGIKWWSQYQSLQTYEEALSHELYEDYQSLDEHLFNAGEVFKKTIKTNEISHDQAVQLRNLFVQIEIIVLKYHDYAWKWGHYKNELTLTRKELSAADTFFFDLTNKTDPQLTQEETKKLHHFSELTKEWSKVMDDVSFIRGEANDDLISNRQWWLTLVKFEQATAKKR
ncbi:hypothetical protein [Fictibacillus sp. KU28468]|uniref:hypothetical protein n=1 Tax=Fictibacillus sp. KU28468 TaxID=2991053 RepID=UPI00223E07F8|nr:hypothetical protein [Fictibacillus sp. KU28468]UZJ76809.1 hypothetical protein OKX00_11285 [Fictibacillus sp. KU28468]